MDVLLLTPVDPVAYQIIPDLGLMYVAASLREAGLTVAIVDCRRDGLDYEDVVRLATEARPLVVGIKCYSNESVRAARMAESIRASLPESVIVVGGPHPSMDAEGALAEMAAVDYAFIGESELTFPPFAQWIKDGRPGSAPPDEVQGIAWRGEDGVVRREFLLPPDLDAIPLPAWDLMPPDRYDEAAGIFVKSFPVAPMMLSRGCPVGCEYCGCRFISGSRIRYRSAESVLAEVDFLEREYGVGSFTFVDDNFTWHRDKAVAVFEALASRDRRVSFTFSNGVRADRLDADLLALMESAGCFLFGMGIESGNESTFKKMKKKQNVDTVRETVNLVREKTNIQITGFFILGYPGETMAEVKKTVNLALSLPIHHAHFSQFMPIPGTPIYHELVAEGWINPETLDKESVTNDQATELPGLPAADLQRLQKLAYLRLYLTPWRFINLMKLLVSGGLAKVIFRRFIKLFK